MVNKELSRREFLKKAGIAAGAAAGGSFLLSSCATTGGGQSVPDTWDYEADVVVLGFGGAGACAAIEAHDAGAKVLILEKQKENHHFCNTRMAGGVWHNPHKDGDPKALQNYVKAMMSGENIPGKLEGEMPDHSDAMSKMYCEGIMKVQDFLGAQDPDLDIAFSNPSGEASFPMFPSFKEAKYGGTIGTRYKVPANPDPAESAKRNYLRPKPYKTAGEAFWWALTQVGCKEKRKIQVMYETRANGLIRGDDGEIKGVTALQNGKTITVKAKRSVVLTTGGFEYNVKMRRAFLEGPGIHGWGFYGSPDNTGDGIEMAILIGAGLVKVAKSASRIESAFPWGDAYTKAEHDYDRLKMGSNTAVTASRNSVVVDNYGKRYTDENIITDSKQPYRYQFYKRACEYDLITMRYPRIPSWVIFDETNRKRACVINTTGSTGGYDFIPWSKDNMEMINKGWILKADTLDELAKKINADPENREFMTADALKKTVSDFNKYCAAGKDDEFGRPTNTMGPVETPPYYAMKLYPGGPNTKGGIDADEKRQVLDWEGKPIPRLFSAGEISSVFKFTYQGGGNLTECVVCGRVAGKNAAAEKPWA